MNNYIVTINFYEIIITILALIGVALMRYGFYYSSCIFNIMKTLIKNSMNYFTPKLSPLAQKIIEILDTTDCGFDHIPQIANKNCKYYSFKIKTQKDYNISNFSYLYFSQIDFYDKNYNEFIINALHPNKTINLTNFFTISDRKAVYKKLITFLKKDYKLIYDQESNDIINRLS